MICQKYYNSTSLHIVCALLMCLTCSCGKNANERIVSEIKAMTGRTIVFPNGYQTISCDKTVNMKKCLHKAKARKMARRVVDFREKVTSPATNEMKDKAKQILSANI